MTETKQTTEPLAGSISKEFTEALGLDQSSKIKSLVKSELLGNIERVRLTELTEGQFFKLKEIVQAYVASFRATNRLDEVVTGLDVEAQPEAKPEAQPEAKPEAQPEAKPEAKRVLTALEKAVLLFGDKGFEINLHKTIAGLSACKYYHDAGLCAPRLLTGMYIHYGTDWTCSALLRQKISSKLKKKTCSTGSVRGILIQLQSLGILQKHAAGSTPNSALALGGLSTSDYYRMKDQVHAQITALLDTYN